MGYNALASIVGASIGANIALAEQAMSKMERIHRLLEYKVFHQPFDRDLTPPKKTFKTNNHGGVDDSPASQNEVQVLCVERGSAGDRVSRTQAFGK